MGLINSGVAQVKGPVEYEGGKGSDNEPAGAVSVKPDAIEKEDVEEVEETQRKKECRKKEAQQSCSSSSGLSLPAPPRNAGKLCLRESHSTHSRNLLLIGTMAADLSIKVEFRYTRSQNSVRLLAQSNAS